MRPADVRRLRWRTRRIHGYLDAGGALLFGLLDEVQRSAGIDGHLFEIGAHHGKSAVLLGAMARPGETVGVCDIFASQELNVSASGAGDRGIFERNMASFAPGAHVEVHQKPSSDLTAAEITRPCRIFHVDGGHLLEEALADIHLGLEVLHDSGAVVIDDPFRPEWAGVTEAILRALAEDPALEPVMVGFNKLVLARGGARAVYDEAITTDRAWAYFPRLAHERKRMPLAGRTMTVLYLPTYRRLAGLDTPIAVTRTGLSWARRRLTG